MSIATVKRWWCGSNPHLTSQKHNASPEDTMRFDRFLGACRRKGRTRIRGTLIAPHACGLAVFILLLLLAPRSVFADPVVINFEGLSDRTAVTTQYAGLTFSNAIILTSGISLNEFE